jgi:hypothetical protein
MATKQVKYCIQFLLLTILFNCCKTYKPLYVNFGGTIPNKNASLKILVTDYVKHYAFCKCVENSFKKDSTKFNDGSIYFLREMGDDVITLSVDSIISIEAKTYIFSEVIGVKYVDGLNKKNILADCIFFSESERIKKIADSVSKSIKHFNNYWGN